MVCLKLTEKIRFSFDNIFNAFFLELTEKIRNHFDNIINIKAMTIKIYDQDTNNYLDSIFLNEKSNKKEVEQNIKEYYNLNEIYYSIS